MKYRVKVTHVTNWVRENYDRVGVITGEPTFFLTDQNGDKWFDADNEHDAEVIEQMEKTTAESLEAMRQSNSLYEQAKARREYLRRCLIDLDDELDKLESEEETIYGEWGNLDEYCEAHQMALETLDELTNIMQKMAAKCDFIYGLHGTTERQTHIWAEYNDDTEE